MTRQAGPIRMCPGGNRPQPRTQPNVMQAAIPDVPTGENANAEANAAAINAILHTLRMRELIAQT